MYARYDDICKGTFPTLSQQGTAVVPCKFNLPELKQDMAPPIFVYYGIDNMYLNHRRCG